MAKHVYYKKSKRLYLPFVGKMDKQARLQKKRQQRHHRETSARIDRFVSSYVQHKYKNIYVEAKEFHDQLKELYPYKHDLKKTVEYETWKKQPTGKKTSTSKDMELKIKLMNYNPKTTTTATTTTTTSQINEESTAQTTVNEGSTAAQVLVEDTAQNTAMEQDIWPSLDLDIPPEMLERIIAELDIGSVHADFQNLIEEEEEQTEIDLEFENLGAEITIDEQYTLEDELALY